MTGAVDLESGEGVHVAEGRDEKALRKFLKRLKIMRIKIKAFALDMRAPCIAAIRERFPRAKLVFDRYHVMAQYSRLLDELRRGEHARASKTEKAVFKGTRYLLLKGKEKLVDDVQAQAKLNRLLKLNQSSATAYILKEELRTFWDGCHRREARQLLGAWFRKAIASGMGLLRKFVNTLFRPFVTVMDCSATSKIPSPLALLRASIRR